MKNFKKTALLIAAILPLPIVATAAEGGRGPAIVGPVVAEDPQRTLASAGVEEQPAPVIPFVPGEIKVVVAIPRSAVEAAAGQGGTVVVTGDGGLSAAPETNNGIAPARGISMSSLRSLSPDLRIRYDEATRRLTMTGTLPTRCARGAALRPGYDNQNNVHFVTMQMGPDCGSEMSRRSGESMSSISANVVPNTIVLQDRDGVVNVRRYLEGDAADQQFEDEPLNLTDDGAAIAIVSAESRARAEEERRNNGVRRELAAACEAQDWEKAQVLAEQLNENDLLENIREVAQNAEREEKFAVLDGAPSVMAAKQAFAQCKAVVTGSARRDCDVHYIRRRFALINESLAAITMMDPTVTASETTEDTTVRFRLRGRRAANVAVTEATARMVDDLLLELQGSTLSRGQIDANLAKEAIFSEDNTKPTIVTLYSQLADLELQQARAFQASGGSRDMQKRDRSVRNALALTRAARQVAPRELSTDFLEGEYQAIVGLARDCRSSSGGNAEDAADCVSRLRPLAQTRAERLDRDLERIARRDPERASDYRSFRQSAAQTFSSGDLNPTAAAFGTMQTAAFNNTASFGGNTSGFFGGPIGGGVQFGGNMAGSGISPFQFLNMQQGGGYNPYMMGGGGMYSPMMMGGGYGGPSVMGPPGFGGAPMNGGFGIGGYGGMSAGGGWGGGF